MRTSEQINEIAGALAKAQGEIKAAEKDRTNPHFGQKYATLDSLWDAVRGPLSAHGLSLVQGVASQVDGEGVMVIVTTRLTHASGQWFESDLGMWPKDASPQAIGSVITYGRRYGLAAMAGVTAEEDDDANAAQAPKKVPGWANRPAPKSLVPPEVVGQPDRPIGNTTEAEVDEAFGDSREFMLGAVRRKVEKGYDFSAKEREALKKAFLKGKAADLADTADLRELYLFLGDPEAVKQWRAELVKKA